MKISIRILSRIRDKKIKGIVSISADGAAGGGSRGSVRCERAGNDLLVLRSSVACGDLRK